MRRNERTRWRAWLAAGAVLLVIVARVATATVLTVRDATRGAGAHAGVGLSGLPDMPADTRRAYEAAPSHHELFAHVPCYCGCAVLAGPHASLERCFLLPDGSLERHAAGCRICTDIAVDALVLERQGLGHPAIRTLIDMKYARAGPGTDTPLP